jgi:hypothetical protein
MKKFHTEEYIDFLLSVSPGNVHLMQDRMLQVLHNVISHNVLIKWFQKVNSPTRPSTCCFNLSW